MSWKLTECDHHGNHDVQPASGTAIDPNPPACNCEHSGTCPLEDTRAKARISLERKRNTPPTQTVTSTETAARFFSN